jgi:hypothetical protein
MKGYISRLELSRAQNFLQSPNQGLQRISIEIGFFEYTLGRCKYPAELRRVPVWPGLGYPYSICLAFRDLTLPHFALCSHPRLSLLYRPGCAGMGFLIGPCGLSNSYIAPTARLFVSNSYFVHTHTSRTTSNHPSGSRNHEM